MIKTQTISTKDFFENSLKKVNLTSSRKELLLRIAETIAKEYSLNEVVHLNFICTHNSRRSQLGQVWGFYAAHYFGLNIKWVVITSIVFLALFLILLALSPHFSKRTFDSVNIHLHNK